MPSMSPSPVPCLSADHPGSLTSIPLEMPTRTIDILSLQILSTEEWGNNEILKNWFDALRTTVRGVIHRLRISIHEARQLFEESRKIHYKNHKNLRFALEKVAGFWLAFSKEDNLTVEYLRRQEFLCNGLMPIASYMCTPKKVSRKYNRKMRSIRKDTRAIAHEATRIWCMMEEIARKIEGQKSRTKESDQPQQCKYIGSEIGSAELVNPKCLQGEGFEQLVQCLSPAFIRYHTQNDHCLEIQASWQLPEAFNLHNNSILASILAVSGNEMNAQMATIKEHLQEHFYSGGVLLEGLQAALDTKAPAESQKTTKGMRNLSIRVEESGGQRVNAIISGVHHTLVDLAKAMAWIVCAVRPTCPEGLSLSTFKFKVHHKASPVMNCVVTLEPTWGQTTGVISCWHRFFDRVMVVSNGPMKSREAFENDGNDSNYIQLPIGLEMPFDFMLEFGAIDFPFQHSKGIVLKGTSTILVAIAAWKKPTSAVQWHYVDSEKETELCEFVENNKYHIWEEEDALDLGNMRQNGRTFVGWAESFDIHLSEVPFEHIRVTSAKKAYSVPVLDSIAAGVGFSKIGTGGVTANFSMAPTTVKRTEDANFHELLTRASSAPVLVYSPGQDRGWMIPKLPLIELMMSIHIDQYGFGDQSAPANLNLERTRQMLLASLQDETLKEILASPESQPKVAILTFNVRTLFVKMYDALGYAIHCCRYQQWPRMFADTIYGLEIRNLTLRHDEYNIKKHRLRHRTTWISFLQKKMVHGSVFCDGLGDVLVAKSCPSCMTLPCDQSYLAVAVTCLEYLKEDDKLPADFGLDMSETAFETQDDYHAFSHHVQEQDMAPSGSNLLAKHPKGVIVFGKRKER